MEPDKNIYRHRGDNYAERAKLFLPFDALKGFREALAEKEHIIVPRIELSEEMAEELDRKLRQLRPGDMITAVYYSNSEYVEQSGLISRIDPDRRILQIVETRIPFDDIVEIR